MLLSCLPNINGSINEHWCKKFQEGPPESQNFGWMSNASNTPLPIVDPETGEVMAMQAPDFLSKLKKEKPEVHKQVIELRERIGGYLGEKPLKDGEDKPEKWGLREVNQLLKRVERTRDAVRRSSQRKNQLMKEREQLAEKDSYDDDYGNGKRKMEIEGGDTIDELDEATIELALKEEALRKIEKELATLTQNIRENITADIERLPFLDNIRNQNPEVQTQKRIETLRTYGNIADNFIEKEVIRHYATQHAKDLVMTNEAKGVNDPAELLLMTLNTSYTPRVRFEARRKLALIEMLGNLEDYGQSEIEREASMQRMNNFMNNHMIVHGGNGGSGKKGAVQKKTIVSEHSVDEDKRTKKAALRSTEEVEQILGKKDKRFTPIQMRQVNIRDEAGGSRNVPTYWDTRKKGIFERLIKRMRKDEPLEKIDEDHNGVRMVFETTEDCRDFAKTLIDRLQKAINAKMRNQYTDPEDTRLLKRLHGNKIVSVDREAVQEWEKKNKEEKMLKEYKERGGIIIWGIGDNLESGEFKGNSSGSSSKLKLLKFDLVFQDAEGKWHTYEYQIFNLKGYADALYREEVNWQEYSIARLFKEGIPQLLFPSAIYGNLNWKAIAKKRAEEARKKAWKDGSKEGNGIAQEKAIAHRRKKRQQALKKAKAERKKRSRHRKKSK